MSNRTQLAHFLLGFFVMPVSILLGAMEVMFFKWHGGKAIACIAFFILFPLLGSLRTKQRVLTMGIIAGTLMTGLLYWGCSKMGTSTSTSKPVSANVAR